MENHNARTNGVENSIQLERQTSKLSLEEELPTPVTAQKIPVEIELTDYMKKCLAVVAKNEGFKNYTLAEQKGSNVGDGFVGILFKVHIQEIASDKRLTVMLKVFYLFLIFCTENFKNAFLGSTFRFGSSYRVWRLKFV